MIKELLSRRLGRWPVWAYALVVLTAATLFFGGRAAIRSYSRSQADAAYQEQYAQYLEQMRKLEASYQQAEGRLGQLQADQEANRAKAAEQDQKIEELGRQLNEQSEIVSKSRRRVAAVRAGQYQRYSSDSERERELDQLFP